MMTTHLSIDHVKHLAARIRRHSLMMTRAANSSHVASCLSCADLLAVLYGRILHVSPSEPEAPNRDRFVQSKGHAAAALYAVLAERGFLAPERLATFCQKDSPLLGHVTRGAAWGVEFSTGSLGHGLSVSVGMALAAKRDQRPYRVFCLLSDGDCDEGSTWEAAMLASHHELDNLVAIVDYNKVQSLAPVADVVRLEPFASKWMAFGWHTVEIDGHDVAAIDQALAAVPVVRSRPTCVIAHTVKGKGVSFMEDTVLWHYRSPQGEEFERALAELEADAE